MRGKGRPSFVMLLAGARNPLFLPRFDRLPRRLVGTLSKDDDDGSENDGKKMNLRSFKLNRVCLDPLNMSNAGDFS